MESVVLLKNVRKTYYMGNEELLVLKGIDLDIKRGEFISIMGPSGSGKSTLLATLSGLLRPDAGQVLSLNHDIWAMTEKEREQFRRQYCGFIFQGYNLFPALTARQQLEMVLRWGNGLNSREAGERTNFMLDLLGLTKKAELRPNQLSGGEKQRVAIGRALIKEPSFVFADEPTAALDWKHGEQVIDLLRTAAHDAGATILVVAHDSRLIPHVDRVFHLDDGSLVERGESSFPLGHEPAVVAAQY